MLRHNAPAVTVVSSKAGLCASPQAAKRAVLLSGTACLSRPYEVITQLQALLPAAKLKADDFADRYCTGDRCAWLLQCRCADVEMWHVCASHVEPRAAQQLQSHLLPGHGSG
jgi:hypothetical protein